MKIEFRYSAVNDRYELVKLLDTGECFTVAYFIRDRDGWYDMRTVGGRFFFDEDAWEVGKRAINLLNNYCPIHGEQDGPDCKRC